MEVFRFQPKSGEGMYRNSCFYIALGAVLEEEVQWVDKDYHPLPLEDKSLVESAGGFVNLNHLLESGLFRSGFNDFNQLVSWLRPSTARLFGALAELEVFLFSFNVPDASVYLGDSQCLFNCTEVIKATRIKRRGFNLLLNKL